MTEENKPTETISTDINSVSAEEAQTNSDAKTVEQTLSAEEEIRLSSLDRKDLIETIEDIVKNKRIKEDRHSIALIKLNFADKTQAWKDKLKNEFQATEEQPVFEYIEDDLDDRFRKANQAIRKEKQKAKEEEERIKQDNLDKKLAVLEDLRKLIDSEESLKTTYDEFKKLQESWKEIGQIPKTEINNLWQNYHFLVEKFFDKVKINKDLRDLDLKKNLEQKIELCEKVEELLLETSINKSFKLLQEYHDKWKEIGPVAADKKDELWERFKTASDAINKKRRDFYDAQKNNLEQNLLAKSALCEKAKDILDRPLTKVNDWNKANDEISELLNLWKQIGRVPASQNEDIWTQFKDFLNAFYEKKRQFFNEIKNEQLNNLNLKINLCIQAEAIALRDDFKNATEELLALQEEWKKIGPTSKKHADKVWKRFRAACDQFFEKKNSYYSETRSKEKENLKLKEGLIDEINKIELADDKKAQLAAIKDFQKRWLEIGHVPLREKDRLHKEYRTAINTLMGSLNIHPGELHASSFASKYTNIQNPEDADSLSNKDIQLLQNKIHKLREDILLWENNVEFFAKSKNADILKKEFESKIQRAKQELALLEAKMKIIRQR